MSAQGNKPEQASTVKVVEEHLAVGTVREEIGALRVRIESDVHAQAVTLDRAIDHVVVERLEVNRRVEQRRDPWYDDDTLVVPVYGELAVVERQLVLTAEIRLRRQVTRSATTSNIPVTRQRAVIERRSADGTWTEIDPDPV